MKRRITFVGCGPALLHPEKIKNVRDYKRAIWRERERQALRIALDAAWCFVLTAVVLIGGIVLLCYFVDWLVGPAS